MAGQSLISRRTSREHYALVVHAVITILMPPAPSLMMAAALQEPASSQASDIQERLHQWPPV